MRHAAALLAREILALFYASPACASRDAGPSAPRSLEDRIKEEARSSFLLPMGILNKNVILGPDTTYKDIESLPMDVREKEVPFFIQSLFVTRMYDAVLYVATEGFDQLKENDSFKKAIESYKEKLWLIEDSERKLKDGYADIIFEKFEKEGLTISDVLLEAKKAAMENIQAVKDAVKSAEKSSLKERKKGILKGKGEPEKGSKEARDKMLNSIFERLEEGSKQRIVEMEHSIENFNTMHEMLCNMLKEALLDKIVEAIASARLEAETANIKQDKTYLVMNKLYAQEIRDLERSYKKKKLALKVFRTYLAYGIPLESLQRYIDRIKKEVESDRNAEALILEEEKLRAKADVANPGKPAKKGRRKASSPKKTAQTAGAEPSKEEARSEAKPQSESADEKTYEYVPGVLMDLKKENMPYTFQKRVSRWGMSINDLYMRFGDQRLNNSKIEKRYFGDRTEQSSKEKIGLDKERHDLMPAAEILSCDNADDYFKFTEKKDLPYGKSKTIEWAEARAKLKVGGKEQVGTLEVEIERTPQGHKDKIYHLMFNSKGLKKGSIRDALLADKDEESRAPKEEDENDPGGPFVCTSRYRIIKYLDRCVVEWIDKNDDRKKLKTLSVFARRIHLAE